MESKGIRVLVVEDNEINMEIVADMLDALGMQMVGAENGKEAVEKLTDAEEGDFDVVLMDIHMPIMDGIEAAKSIRASKMPLKNIPILAMTGDALAEDRKRVLEAGMNGLVAKPATMERIVNAIEQALEE